MTHDKECSRSQFVPAAQKTSPTHLFANPFVLAAEKLHWPKQPHHSPKTRSAQLLVTVDLAI
jgi:hypothetical protein